MALARWLVVLLGLGVAALAVWLLRDPETGDSHVPGRQVDHEESAADDLRSPRLDGRGGGRAGGSTAPLPVSPPSAAGGPARLLLRVAWAESREPLAGVEILAWDPQDRPWTVRTDAEGRVAWRDAAPGHWALETALGGELDVDVVAGQTTDVQWLVAEGLTIEGCVVGAGGAPVAEAELWLGYQASPINGGVVARADERGAFRLRVAEPTVCIGAHAANHAPSERHVVSGEPGQTVAVRLVLPGRGGSLDVLVRDADGAPLPGALVLVGTGGYWSVQTRDAEKRYLGKARTARTDAEGRARLDGLAPGETPVHVRAPGRALLARTIAIPPEAPAWLDLRLEHEAVVRGVVRDTAGRPVPGADVRWEPARDLVPTHPTIGFARTDEEGRYELPGLPLGALTLEAEARDAGRDVGHLVLAAGEEVRWDPVLGSGGRIAGRLVDESGSPLADWSVWATATEWRFEGRMPGARADTDAQGRFALTSLPDLPYRLAAEPRGGGQVPPRAWWPGVRPGLGERTWVVGPLPDPASVQGRILDADGRPRGGSVRVTSVDTQGTGTPAPGTWFADLDEKTGRFRFAPCPPGTYELTGHADGLPSRSLGRLVLVEGEVRDLGDVRLPATGRLLVQVKSRDGSPLGDVEVDVERDGEWLAGGELEEGARRFPQLYEGQYEVTVWGDVLDEPGLPCTVRAGEETALTLLVSPGIRQGITCWIPVEEPFPTQVQIDLVDADGATLEEETIDLEAWGRSVRRLERERETGRRELCGFSYGLRAGRYRLRLGTDTGLGAEAAFDVAPGPSPPDLDLVLTRIR
jgi:protocatechuate 3,4-dioxygenase beta subunit